MKKIGFIVIISLLILGCSTPEYVSHFQVRNIKSIDSVTHDYLVYCLPKTTLRIGFEVTKTIKNPGPYGEYAEVLLGLDNIIENHSESYEITHIDISSYAVPDEDHYYVVEFDTTQFDNLFQFTENGYLISTNHTPFPVRGDLSPEISLLPRQDPFSFGRTDRFLKRNVESRTEKRYRTVRTDSSSYRVPYSTKYSEPKSIKDNAEEAANFIIKLRKRKFKLMAGLYENAPDGVGVENMIKELQDLEANYVALFTGDIEKVKYYYEFDYTPDPNNAIKTYTLCYFSDLKGIMTLNELSSSPNLEKGMNIRPLNVNVSAEIISLKKLDNISHAVKKNGLVYRIPVFSEIEIIRGNEILFESKAAIAQFGKNVYLPKKYLTKEYQIEFYPDTGAIKSIQRN